ncbi:MAG: ABC transporter permease subunit [Candidatus Nitrohelix vancouverensis]|uniref:ABC transporter permease subunit n=1 Tax=Candidatus Nitrohelix vancouverensis TaxID=2705534 RepID=A0A7T0G435_9BACT|nr:MAG: ABC transporter permease subunit [Candidatus Nitrohelix vancouverensis]
MKLNKELEVKIQKFRRDRRAYVSFIILSMMFLLTLPAEFLCNVRPILLVVDGKIHFPILLTYSERDFGGTLPSEPDYNSRHFHRLLYGEEKSAALNNESSDASLSLDDFEDSPGMGLGLDDFEETSPSLDLGMADFEDGPATQEKPDFSLGLGDFEDTGNPLQSASIETSPAQPTPPKEVWALWPPIRYDYKYIPSESQTGKVVLAAPYETMSANGEEVIESAWKDGHYLGTDDRGRDILARLIYGLRISMIFGLSLAVTGTIIGCFLGGFQGFFGGWVDLVGQRLTEIWGSIPRLYILIILSAFLVPSAILLFLILNLTAWMGIAAYIRAEFLKIRNFEFVKAAKAMGVSDFQIMRRHILPNAITPVVTFFPFEVTAGILALVSLDYLNLGVPSPAPSIGELLSQGKNNLQAIWIILPTFAVLTATITLLTFVGEGIRNAFDPRRNA